MNPPFKIAPGDIGFDLDGVIADTGAAFVKIACEEYGYCSFTLDDITNFDLQGCIDIPSGLVDRIFTDILLDSLATGLTPMDGAVEVLSELAEHSPVTVITARDRKKPVMDWLEEYFPSATVKVINLIAMGDHDDKLKYIKKHQLKYFIDDRAETCTMLAANNINPLVYSHPWNRERHSLPTVNNWTEIRNIIDLP